MNGWVGKILRVDLSTGDITKEETSRYLDYTGGIGFGFKVIFDEAPTADPFSAENRIIFAAGPLTGTFAPCTGRSEVISISPHVYAPKAKHSLVSRSGFGGYWGPELKFAGYDALIVQGKAKRPVFINIAGDTVTMENGDFLWGKDAFVTQDLIKEKLKDEDVQIIAIGPSGERLVRCSPIMHRTGNAAGQGGFGAVMGSKNLKAVAVRGKGGVSVAHKKELIKYVKSLREIQPAPLSTTPLSHHSLSWTEKHIDPTDINQQALRFNQAKGNAPWLNKYRTKSLSCFSCPQGCYAYLKVTGMGGGQVSCTQWYYSWLGNKDTATFQGSQLANKIGIDTFEMVPLVQLIWYLQDEVVSGKSILRLMHEKGLVADENWVKLEKTRYPPKGEMGAEALENIISLIAYRQGFLGDCLAEGFRRATDLIAAELKRQGLTEAAERVMAFEHMEGILGGAVGGHGGWGMAGHYDPRTFGYYWAVNFAMENRDPNRHSMPGLLEWSGLNFEQALYVAKQHWGDEVAENGLSDLYRERNEPLVWNGAQSARANAAITQFIHQRACIKDSIQVCDWVYPMMTSGREDRKYVGDISAEYRLFELVTGEKGDQEALDIRAARIWNVHRLITAMEWGNGAPVNLRVEHDQLPEHYFAPVESRLLPPFPPFDPPHPPLIKEYFEATKTEYYKLMGWDVETGLPTRATLKKLGMEDERNSFESRAFRLPA